MAVFITKEDDMFLAIVSAIVGLIIICVVAADREKNGYSPELRGEWYIKTILPMFLKHYDALESAYLRGNYIGNFGEKINDSWNKELDYFVSKIVIPSLAFNRHFCFYVGWMMFPISNEDTSISIIDETGKEKAFVQSDNIIMKPKTIKINAETKGMVFDYRNYIQKKQRLTNNCFVYAPLAWQEPYSAVMNMPKLKNSLFLMFDELAQYYFNQQSSKSLSKKSVSPIDYEYQVAEELVRQGFNAHATKASGDQGADVLAEKEEVTFAIQCKMYSHPVGNKAVQEANTARDFYNCDYAVVVTNASFTKGAYEAAKASNVILLNDNQLDKLNNYIK